MVHHKFLLVLLILVFPKALAGTTKSINFQVSNGLFTDEAILGFNSAASDGFDDYDSYKFTNNNVNIPEIFFLADGEEVVINKLGYLIANKEVALGFRTGKAGTFSIQVTQTSNLEFGTSILLKDHLLDVEQELTPGLPYSFSSVAETTSSRFSVIVTQPLGKGVASNRLSADHLGSAVALSGDYAIAGNNPFDGSGSVDVFKRIDQVWVHQQKLTAMDGTAGDQFGHSVSINNNCIVVGAPGEDEDAAGGNTLVSAGSVYIFKKEGETWVQAQKLVATDRSSEALFGSSVSISANQLLVGAPGDDSGTGAAYLFNYSAGTWVLMHKTMASDKQVGDHFGQSVSISGKSILVGAVDEDEDASGLNTMVSAGAAYLFRTNEGTCIEIKKLVASDRAPGDGFGGCVSISGDFAIVGAAYEDEDGSGSNTKSDAGSAYLFNNTSGSWTYQQKIVASDRTINNQFGRSVSIFGNTTLIGATNASDDFRGGNSLASAGAVYFFTNRTGSWTQNQKINAADRETNDQFGTSVCFSGKYGIIGNPNDAHDATGNNSLSAAGSVSFIRNEPPKRTWNGSSWGIVPTASDSAMIDGNYVGEGFSCMDLVVNAGKKLSVTSTLNVYGSITLKSDAPEGSATFIDQGNEVFCGNGVNVEQFLTGSGGTTPTGRFWYLSVPLSETSSRAFDLINNNPLNKLWSFSEASVSYAPMTSTQVLKPGVGYVARLGADKTVVLSGNELTTGDTYIPVTQTGTSNVKRGFNLIGNPYPSFVELQPIDNPGLEPTIWYRSLSASGTTMVFDTYNLTSKLAVVASGSGELTSYIPPMQAFWVKWTTEGSGNVVFRNSKRSLQSGIRLRSSEGETVRLQVSDGAQTDETLIGFFEGALTEFDAFDSHKLSNDNALIPEIHTLAGAEKVAINGLPANESHTYVPIGLRLGKKGSYTLKLKEGNVSDATFSLQDQLLNTTIDLHQGIEYSFQSDGSDSADRFGLFIDRTNSEIRNDFTRKLDIFGTEDNHLLVLLDGKSDFPAEILVYDALGRTQKLADQSFSPGIYLVKVTTPDFTGHKKVRIGR